MSGWTSPGRLTSFRCLNNIRKTKATLLIAPLDRITAQLHFKIGPSNTVESKYLDRIYPVWCSPAWMEGQAASSGDLRSSVKQGHGCFCPVTPESSELAFLREICDNGLFFRKKNKKKINWQSSVCCHVGFEVGASHCYQLYGSFKLVDECMHGEGSCPCSRLDSAVF